MRVTLLTLSSQGPGNGSTSPGGPSFHTCALSFSDVGLTSSDAPTALHWPHYFTLFVTYFCQFVFQPAFISSVPVVLSMCSPNVDQWYVCCMYVQTLLMECASCCICLVSFTDGKHLVYIIRATPSDLVTRGPSTTANTLSQTCHLGALLKPHANKCYSGLRKSVENAKKNQIHHCQEGPSEKES